MAIPKGVGSSGGYIATPKPIETGQRRGILAPFTPSVAVFVQDPVHVPLMLGEAFARVYGRIGGELRVLLALSLGRRGTETADSLGVRETTLRMHLNRIFSKTGTSRHAEFVGIMHRSRPSVAQTAGASVR